MHFSYTNNIDELANTTSNTALITNNIRAGFINIIIDENCNITTYGILTDTPVITVRSFTNALEYCATNNISNVIATRDVPYDIIIHSPWLLCITDGQTQISYENTDERNYLNLLRKLIAAPIRRNRTAINTRGVFHEVLKFNLADSRGAIIPLLTTKKINWESVYHETIWFLSGACTDTTYLKKNGVNIWDGNSSREYLDSRGLNYPAGTLGPIYGYQWRHWNAAFHENVNPDNAITNDIDQLAAVISTLKTDPWDRRMIVTAWNPSANSKMALPACFIAGTKVLTHRGYVDIEQVKMTDQLLTHKNLYRKINNIFKTNYSGQFIILHVGGRHIVCTPDHPFYCRLGPSNYIWIRAAKLTIGSMLAAVVTSEYTIILENDYAWCPVADINYTRMKTCVYNFDVDIDHTYIVETIHVHNCHYSFQFHVDPEDGRPKYLNCLVNMRSADCALGVPWNIFSYSLITHIVAHITGLTPGILSVSMADCHIYENHIAKVSEQLTRAPRRFPTIRFAAGPAQTIDEFINKYTINDIIIANYVPHPPIKLSMAV